MQTGTSWVHIYKQMTMVQSINLYIMLAEKTLAEAKAIKAAK